MAENNDLFVENGLENVSDTTPVEDGVPQANAGQTRRLMITHIVNEFFKSYAGKQTLGPFHKVRVSLSGEKGPHRY